MAALILNIFWQVTQVDFSRRVAHGDSHSATRGIRQNFI